MKTLQINTQPALITSVEWEFETGGPYTLLVDEDGDLGIRHKGLTQVWVSRHDIRALASALTAIADQVGVK